MQVLISLHTRLFILLTVVIVSIFSACGTSSPPREEHNTAKEIRAVSPEEVLTQDMDILFEEPELPQVIETILPPHDMTPAEDSTLTAKKSLPRIAIIIDDMGHHERLGRQLLDLELNLTYSFLPHAPFTMLQEELAFQKGRDILVHLPMEPKDPTWNPGRNALYLDDAPETITALTKELLAAVPHANGANNHMGSRFTENRAYMNLVLSVLKDKEYFFIDSYTTAASMGLEEAQRLGIPVARRHIFLDNVQNSEKICQQIEKLIDLAQSKGWAIGIGHPNKATLMALTRCDKNLLQSVEIVGVHQLVQKK